MRQLRTLAFVGRFTHRETTVGNLVVSVGRSGNRPIACTFTLSTACQTSASW